MHDVDIRWPLDAAPARAVVHVRNAVVAAAPPAVVWQRIVRAAEWPSRYDGASDVRLADGATDLRLGTRFTWRTFGVRLHSEVVEYEPDARIAWTANGPALFAYQAWVISPAGAGCRIVMEETQRGVLAYLGKPIGTPRRIEAAHQRWLEAFARI